MNLEHDAPGAAHGFIGPGLYLWWAAGVCVGAVLVALGASLFLTQFKPAQIWIGAFASALVFLCMFDTRGKFRPFRMIASIMAVVLAVRFMTHQSWPPKLVLALIVAGLLFVYGLCGAAGMALGQHVQQRRPGAGVAGEEK